MRLADGSHLTYCTNIHPGESLAEVRANLATHVVAVKRRVCPNAPFGVGLRLSARAADELRQGAALDELRAFLAANDLYVFTLNGFPHGRFHGAAVKERVYLPDWRDAERVRYTTALADILAALLPPGVAGSISTVPCAFRTEVRAQDVPRITVHLVTAAAHLARLHERTGRMIVLALEPEPACHLDTTAEAVEFFRTQLHTDGAAALLARETGLARGAAAEALKRHLGVCLDACHAAVDYEDPADAVRALREAGIPIAKVQLTAGLRLRHADASTRAALEPFADPVYLHQVVARGPDSLARYVDLPDALAAAAARDDALDRLDTLATAAARDDALDPPAALATAMPRDDATAAPEWRVHFHVPLFHARFGALESTREVTASLLEVHRERPVSPHLEAETYTWDVLPPDARIADVDDGIARELEWILGVLGDHARARNQ